MELVKASGAVFQKSGKNSLFLPKHFLTRCVVCVTIRSLYPTRKEAFCADLPEFYQTLTPCPVVELRGYAAANGLKGRLFAYLDFNGPTGTARDGLAEGMLALAIEQKKLAPGQPIIEAVSGPFATALTLAGLTAGHPVVLVMPEDAPALRQENLLRLGAQIQHSPARSGLAGARAMAAQTAAANGWYYTDWLANDNNPEYHRRVTGPAILQNIAREGASLVDAITVGWAAPAP